MGILYTISLIATGASLTAWQLWSRNKEAYLAGMLTFLSLVAYGLIVLSSEISITSKFTVIAKDMFLISIISFIASHITRIRFLRVPYFLLSFVVLFFGSQFFKPFFSLPFSQGIDADAELLIRIDHEQVNSFLAFAKKSDEFKVTPAFQLKDELNTELDDYFIVDILDSNSDKVVLELKERPEVEYLEWNEIIQLDEPEIKELRNMPNVNLRFPDPLNKEQWALYNMHFNDVYDVIDNLKPQKKALLAILDTGIDAEHEDIKDVYVSIDRRYDTDGRGHGTHVAGIAAAVTGNNIGISSMNANNLYNVTSVKVLSNFGSGSQQSIINGMLKAADAGADVISMSLGGRSTDKSQSAYNEAVEYCNKKGAIVVVAAGNSNSQAIHFAPANAKNVICVAAIDQANQKAVFSNTTDNIEMAIAAPGVDILSTLPKNKYEALSGTSMATPYISGFVALMKCFQPSLTTEQAYELLESNATDQAKSKIFNPAESLRKLQVKSTSLSE